LFLGLLNTSVSQPPLVERLVRPLLLPRELLPQIEINSDILMTRFVGNSACTDDQRADTLTYQLAILTQSISFALVHLRALLQEPGSLDRDRRLEAILYALERINTKAMQLGLGKGLEGISHEKQRLETLVAQQQQERKVEQ
jgi:hypothetical protein